MFVPTPKQGKPPGYRGASHNPSVSGSSVAASSQGLHQNNSTSAGTDGTEVVKRAVHKADNNETNGNLPEPPVSINGSAGIKGDSSEAEGAGGLGQARSNGKEGGGGGGGGLGIDPSSQPKIVADLGTKTE